MLIYLAITTFYLLMILYEKNHKFNKYIKFLLIFPLWFLVSFRSLSVGSDTSMYRYLFDTYSNMNFYDAVSHSNLEFGFIALIKIIGDLGFSYFGFQIIISSIIYWFTYKIFSKNSMNFSFSILLFITLFFFSRSMNTIRNILAVLIVTSGFLEYGLYNNRIKLIFHVLFASIFHITALSVLIVYPLMLLKGKYRLFLSILIGPIIAFFMKEFFDMLSYVGVYSYILESQYLSSTIIWAQVANTLIYAGFMVSIVIFMKRNSVYLFNKEYLQTLLAATTLFSLAGLYFGLIDRLLLYFIAQFLIVIPNIYSVSRRSLRSVIYIVSIVSLIYFVLTLIYRNEWHGIVPYQM